MSTELARQEDTRTDLAMNPDPAALSVAMENILATGDLSKLTPEGRVAFYLTQCKSLDLNPYSRPFDWLVLDGKLVLYPNKSCAEQLRRLHQISVKVTRREVVGADTKEPMFVVEVEGRTPTGRTDESTKYVPLTGPRGRLVGRDLANAYAKAETGAKRRLVLSMVGLASPPDPEETRAARFVTVDGTGRILEAPTVEQKALAADPGMAHAIGEPTYESTADEWPEQSAAFDGMPDQRIRPEELEQPKREGPPPSFKNSDAEIAEWRRRWFAIVKGLSLDSDEARARYVAAWTADEWPKNKRTDSLSKAFARMTKAEADDFLGKLSAEMDDERRELLSQAQEAPERGRTGDDVADAFRLTGASEPEQAAAF